MVGNAFDTSNLPKMPTFSSDKLLQKFVQYVSSSSWKFVDIDFRKGLEDFKRRASGQVSGIDLEEMYVNLFSNNVNIIYGDVKKLNFKIPKNGGVFYSGNKAKKLRGYMHVK